MSGKKRLQMQRPAQQQLIVNPWAQNRQLQASYTKLHDEYNRLAQIANQQASVIRQLQDAERLEIRVDETLPPSNEMLIPISSHLQRVDELKAHQHKTVSVVFALGELRLAVHEIDLLTVEANRTKLEVKLSGMDQRLMALMQGVHKAAVEANYESEQLGIIAVHAKLRIDAITYFKRDNGDTLRRVVAETSYDFKQQAAALIDKLQKGVTQGRRIEPLTQRVYDHAKRLKYDENRTWERAGRALVDDFHKRASNLDEIDKQIWKEIENLSDDKRWQYMHSKYHSLKNQLSSV